MKSGNRSASLRRKLIRTVLLACLILSLLPSFGRTQQSTPLKRVLVLYWYGKDFPGNVLFDRGFQASLRGAVAGSVEYYPEYLESDRFPGENQAQILHDYLRRKYADYTISVVVAAGHVAMDFLLGHRDTLFPQTPIVFSAISSPTAEQLAAGPGMTGIVPVNTHSETLDLLLRLHPNTEQVFIISGTLERDKKIERLARKDLEGYESSAQINYLTDLPPDELMTRMKRLPKRSVALFVWQQSRNQQGKLVEAAEALARIAASATVPIYGMSGSHVGRGIVGGYVSTPETNGTRVAEIALRIMNGTRAQDIPVELAPAVPMFDWRQLRRWGISEGKLPPGSIVRFKELTFWDRYKWHILGVLTLCAFQALLIVALLVQRARRQRVEVALRDNEERLKLALGAAHMGAWDWRLHANELKWSGEMRQLFDLSNGKSHVTPELFFDLIHPDDRPAITQAITRTINQGDPYEVEFRTVHKDGSLHWVLGKGKALLDKAGQAGRMLGVYMDITARKQAEDALRKSEARYRGIVEDQTELICRLLPDGTLTFVNESYARCFGQTPEEVVGKSFRPFIPAEEKERIAQFLASFNPGSPVATIEHRVVLPSGEMRWQQWTDRATYDEQGRLIEFQCVGRDTTERKQAEEALRLSEDKFSKAFRSSPDAFVLVRHGDGAILEVNDRWEALLGYHRREVAGCSLVDLGVYANPEDYRRFLKLIEESGSLRDFEAEVQSKGGSIHQVILAAESMTIDSELCLLIIIRDITERLKSQRKLRELTGRLILLQDEERRRIASELHDSLGQSLAIIRNRATICLHDFSDAKCLSEQLEEISATAASAIKEVREIAHNLRPFELTQLGLGQAVESMVKKVSSATSLSLWTEIDRIDGLLSPAAETSVYRIVQEGLNNVLKHAAASEARISIKRVEHELLVSVRDNGRGMSGCGEDNNGNNGGFGLAGIAERSRMLGGACTIDSEPGHGTTVTVRLQLADLPEERAGVGHERPKGARQHG